MSSEPESSASPSGKNMSPVRADRYTESSPSSESSRSSSPFAKISISTTSLTSLLPSFYNLNKSTPNLLTTPTKHHSHHLRAVKSPNASPSAAISDLLARESDVTVSTNVTSQAEYKGFASYVISGLFLIIWLIWAMCPDDLLQQMGIYYYPSRWWAVAVPSIILVTMGYVYVALALYNVEVKTLPLDDLRTIVDDSGVIITELENYRKENEDQFLYRSTSGIWDLPLSDVNKVLYAHNE